MLWGAYQYHQSNGSVNNDAESWGSEAITLAGTAGMMSSGSNEMFYIVPNEQGYIANNYVFNGKGVHTQGLGEKYVLCVEAYRTGSANPNFRYATNEPTGVASYKIQGSVNVTSTTPTVYRLEVDFTKNYRIEFNAVKNCGNFVINNIWVE